MTTAYTNQSAVCSFLTAAKDGALEKLQEFLNTESDCGSLLSSTDEDGSTALHLAARGGRDDIVNYLTEKGADVDARDQDGATPLHYAAKFGHLATVRALVEKGADYKSEANNGLAVLAWAVPHMDVVRYLMECFKANRAAGAKKVELLLNDRIQYEKDLDEKLGSTHIQRNPNLGKKNMVVEHLIKQAIAVNQDRVSRGDKPTIKDSKMEHIDIIKNLTKQQHNVDIINDILQHIDKCKNNHTEYFRLNDVLAKYSPDYIEQGHDNARNILQFDNVALLETFAKQEIFDDETKSQLLGGMLFKTYEAFKVRNVPILDDIETSVTDKSVRLRFINQSGNKNGPSKNIVLDINKRVEFVCNEINRLHQYYSDATENLDAFVLTMRFIAQNVHALKRQIEPTYNRIPWEEMEFVLTNFISCIIKREHSDLVFKLILDKNRVVFHLHNFATTLKQLLPISEEHIRKRGAVPLSRSEIVKSVLSYNTTFTELYEDYDILKDIYSLKEILYYLHCAKSVDVSQSETGKLVAERSLQVIGEYLKNTPTSPNLSDVARTALSSNAPDNINDIVTSLRNSLSHTATLMNKTSIEEENTEVFEAVQKDLAKIETDIEVLLYWRKIHAIKSLADKMVSTNDSNKAELLLNTLDGNCNDVNNFNHTKKNLSKIKILINKLYFIIAGEDAIKNVSLLFSIVKGILDSEENKSQGVVSEYVRSITYLQDTIRLDGKGIQRMAQACLPDLNIWDTRQLEKIVEILQDIYTTVANEVSDTGLLQIEKLIIEINDSIEQDIGRVKGMEQFKNELEATDGKNFIKTLEFIDSVVEDNAKQNHVVILELTKILDDNLISDVDTVFQENAYNALVDSLSVKASTKKKLKTDFSKKEFQKCRELLKKFDDYDILVKAVNSKDFFNTKEFTKLLSSKAVKKTAVEQYRQEIKYYYNQRLNKLKFLINSEDTFDLKATEILLLELSEILEKCDLFADHKHFIDGYSPVLVGKALRNYLAHGNPLVDALVDANSVIIANAKMLVKMGPDLIDKGSGSIGMFDENLLSTDNYERCLNIVDKQYELSTAIKAGDLKKIEECVRDGANLQGRDVNGRSILDFAKEKRDVLEFIAHLMKDNIK